MLDFKFMPFFIYDTIFLYYTPHRLFQTKLDGKDFFRSVASFFFL